MTPIHVLHWHCPLCAQALAHLVPRQTIPLRACPACAREFHVNAVEVFAFASL